jgi:hypothetical protein
LRIIHHNISVGSTNTNSDTLAYQYTGGEDMSQIPGFEVVDDVIIERLGRIFKDMPP